jgi:hypothetical protein
VAGLIALLGGVSQGLQSIGQSVDALIKEQGMHSAYLKPVSVTVDDNVIQFHKQWDELRGKLERVKAIEDLRAVARFSGLLLTGPAARPKATRGDTIDAIVAAAKHYDAQRSTASA